jgi:hypothetical protein
MPVQGLRTLWSKWNLEVNSLLLPLPLHKIHSSTSLKVQSLELPNLILFSSTNSKYIEPVPKAQRMQQQMMGRPTMNSNPQMIQSGGFNPMMAGGFMNPYGGFPNPMMAAGFMGNTGGGRGNMRGGSQGNYMNRGGRGGGMMGYSDGSGFNNGNRNVWNNK